MRGWGGEEVNFRDIDTKTVNTKPKCSCVGSRLFAGVSKILSLLYFFLSYIISWFK